MMMTSYKTGGERIRIKKDFCRTGAFSYFDCRTMKEEEITKDELAKVGNEVPLRCMKFMREIAADPRPMTPDETSDILLLLSLSTGPWRGGPLGKLPTIHIEEYRNVFYLKMVRALTIDKKSAWNPNRARWAAFVPFIRLQTINEITRSIGRVKALEKIVQASRNVPTTPDDSWRNLSVGVGNGSGRKVENIDD